MATATKTPTRTPSKSPSVTTVRPLADRVVVRADEREQTTSSGIVIPDTAKEVPQRGTVVAVGRGRLNDKGTRVAPEVAAGDTVLYARYAGIEVKVGGAELLILKDADVLAILK